jgi:hypothetical protein
MATLLQHVYAFLLHVIDAPETAQETRETAKVLEAHCADAINGNLDPFAQLEGLENDD